jgi:hypothetical protein
MRLHDGPEVARAAAQIQHRRNLSALIARQDIPYPLSLFDKHELPPPY